MIAYKDKTFCRGDGCAKFRDCHRALTAEVESGAKKSGLPVAQFTDPQELACYVTETQENPEDSLF